ncbi:MAG TPA: septum formation initiator family protein [Streptomyces sp.]|nr:septum formation initiator family protein [Streptomyces sp.]
MGRKPRLRGRAARLAQLFPGGQGGGDRAARTPFVLLVVVLLGGGLITLLVLNSALSAGSFRLDDLERQTQDLKDEEQALQRDVDSYSAPDALQRRAQELGMVPGGDPAFLGPDGKVRGVPGPALVPQTANRAPLDPAPRPAPAESMPPEAPPSGDEPPPVTPFAGAVPPEASADTTASPATSGSPSAMSRRGTALPTAYGRGPASSPAPTATPPTPTSGR